jgi:hypothetical protein
MPDCPSFGVDFWKLCAPKRILDALRCHRPLLLQPVLLATEFIVMFCQSVRHDTQTESVSGNANLCCSVSQSPLFTRFSGTIDFAPFRLLPQSFGDRWAQRQGISCIGSSISRAVTSCLCWHKPKRQEGAAYRSSRLRSKPPRSLCAGNNALALFTA